MTERLQKLKKQLARLEKRLDDIYMLRDLMNNMLTEDRRAIGYQYTNKEFAAISKLIHELIYERSELLDEIHTIEGVLSAMHMCINVVVIDKSGE